MFIFTALSVVGGIVVSAGSGAVAKAALNAIVPIASKGSLEILRKVGVMAISAAVASVAAREYQNKINLIEEGAKVVTKKLEDLNKEEKITEVEA